MIRLILLSLSMAASNLTQAAILKCSGQLLTNRQVYQVSIDSKAKTITVNNKTVGAKFKGTAYQNVIVAYGGLYSIYIDSKDYRSASMGTNTLEDLHLKCDGTHLIQLAP